MNDSHHIDFVKINILIFGSAVSAQNVGLEGDRVLLAMGLIYILLSIHNSYLAIEGNIFLNLDDPDPDRFDIRTILLNFSGIIALSLAFLVPEASIGGDSGPPYPIIDYATPLLIGPVWTTILWKQEYGKEVEGHDIDRWKLVKDSISYSIRALLMTVGFLIWI